MNTCTKLKVDFLKIDRVIDIKHVTDNRHFSHHLAALSCLSDFYFLTDFDVSNVFESHFSWSLRKSDQKYCNTYIYLDFLIF